MRHIVNAVSALQTKKDLITTTFPK